MAWTCCSNCWNCETNHWNCCVIGQITQSHTKTIVWSLSSSSTLLTSNHCSLCSKSLCWPDQWIWGTAWKIWNKEPCPVVHLSCCMSACVHLCLLVSACVRLSAFLSACFWGLSGLLWQMSCFFSAHNFLCPLVCLCLLSCLFVSAHVCFLSAFCPLVIGGQGFFVPDFSSSVPGLWPCKNDGLSNEQTTSLPISCQLMKRLSNNDRVSSRLSGPLRICMQNQMKSRDACWVCALLETNKLWTTKNRKFVSHKCQVKMFPAGKPVVTLGSFKTVRKSQFIAFKVFKVQQLFHFTTAVHFAFAP